MSTFVLSEDVNKVINIVYDDCPFNPPSIQINNELGGGGNPANYYINYFKKDSYNNCHEYQSTALTSIGSSCLKLDNGNEICNWNGLLDIVSVGIVNLYRYDIPSLNYSASYCSGETPQNVATDLANFFNTLPNVAYAYSSSILGVWFVFVLYSNTPNFLISCGVTDTGLVDTGEVDCLNLSYIRAVIRHCLGQQPVTHTVCGWQPIAGGFGLISHTPTTFGTYLVEIVDEVGTSNTAVVELTQPEQLCFLEKTDITCNGKNNGTIIVKEFHPELELTFSWFKDGEFFSNQKDLKNLEPGTYCLTIGNTNCFQTCCTTIFEPDALEINVIEIQQPTCVTCRDNTKFGFVHLKVTGGNTDCEGCLISPYEYKINNGEWLEVNETNDIILNNLSQGKYVITVKDCTCCLATYTLTITEQTIIIE